MAKATDKHSRHRSIIRKMGGQRIAVVGDLMADEYIFGETSRVSREAPVLILRYHSRTVGFGGAANAAANILALGGVPVPVGFTGDDEIGATLRTMFRDLGIDTSGIAVIPGTSTVSKTRVIAGGMHTVRQQVLRIDREQDPGMDTSAVVAALDSVIASGVDGLLISDYGCGTIDDGLIRRLNRFCAKRTVVSALDSRHRLTQYRSVDLAAPNEEEAGIHEGDGADDLKCIEKTGESLRKRIRSRALLVTRGSEGISLFEDGRKPHHEPVHGPRMAVDTTGAGDTVVTTALLALCAGASFREAVVIANRAGGLVVMKKGAATVSPDELTVTLV